MIKQNYKCGYCKQPVDEDGMPIKEKAEINKIAKKEIVGQCCGLKQEEENKRRHRYYQQDDDDYEYLSELANWM